MADQYGPYHRLGEPGGPGRAVAALPISARNPDGSLFSADLLDAGKEATEVELLRNIVEHFGVRWGHDDFGWWAVVPREK